MDQAWVSFDAIKAQVFIEDVLRRYGLFDSLQQKGVQLVGHCPLHNDSKPSFKVTPGRNIWHCFGACHLGGDVIDLVRYLEGFTENERTADRRKAALLIAEWFGVESKRPAMLSTRKAAAATETREARPVEEERVRKEVHEAIVEHRIEAPVNPPLTFELKNLDADHPYLRERLTKKTICTFGLGFCSKGYLANRIAIPLHDSDGILIGYAGRWPGDEGWPEDESKYKMPSLEMGFSKKHILFNLHRAREHTSEGLIVVEGFFSGVFALHQRGRYNVVAVMGSSMSAEQEKLIVETAQEQGGNKARVLLAFDDDDAGRRGMQDAAARLAPQVFVRTVELSI